MVVDLSVRKAFHICTKKVKEKIPKLDENNKQTHMMMLHYLNLDSSFCCWNQNLFDHLSLSIQCRVLRNNFMIIPA